MALRFLWGWSIGLNFLLNPWEEARPVVQTTLLMVFIWFCIGKV